MRICLPRIAAVVLKGVIHKWFGDNDRFAISRNSVIILAWFPTASRKKFWFFILHGTLSWYKSVKSSEPFTKKLWDTLTGYVSTNCSICDRAETISSSSSWITMFKCDQNIFYHTEVSLERCLVCKFLMQFLSIHGSYDFWCCTGESFSTCAIWSQILESPLGPKLRLEVEKE